MALYLIISCKRQIVRHSDIIKYKIFNNRFYLRKIYGNPLINAAYIVNN